MQQTRRVKLLAFWGIFQTKEHVLRVNKSKITGGNTLNGYHLDIKGDHKLSKDEINFLGLFLQII